MDELNTSIFYKKNRKLTEIKFILGFLLSPALPVVGQLPAVGEVGVVDVEDLGLSGSGQVAEVLEDLTVWVEEPVVRLARLVQLPPALVAHVDRVELLELFADEQINE